MNKINWTQAERDAFALPDDLTVSQWCDKYRVLSPKTSSEPGQWQTSRTPYLKGIMDSFSDPRVVEITFMKSTQVGGTEALYNMLAYSIDQDPGSALVVLPTIDLAKTASKHRVKPILESSSKLKKYIPSNSDKITHEEIDMSHMTIRFAGANSPSKLASNPCRYVILDEIDKFPKYSGREADPVKLSIERTRTYWNKKIIKTSTPTTPDGYINREYESSDKHRFLVPCPHCGEYQVLAFDQIKVEEGERDTKKIKDERIAWYECIKCLGKIEEFQKTEVISKGVWCPDACGLNKDGEFVNKEGELVDVEDYQSSKRGFWINAIYSPWLSFSDVIAEFFDSKDNPESLMNFINSWLGQVWENEAVKTDEEHLKSLKSDYFEGEIPNDVLVLTASVDVQKDHFWATIRGWGIGEKTWLIRQMRLEQWEDIESEILMTDYEKENGEKMSVYTCGIDSGYRTDEVYDFVRDHQPICKAIKGQQTMSLPYKTVRIEKMPDGTFIKGGIQLYHVNVGYYKDKTARMSAKEITDPGAWLLPSNTPDDYIKQFCSEHKVQETNKKTGAISEYWKKKTSGAQNHFWDCGVYNVALADIIKVKTLRDGYSITHHPKRNLKESREAKEANNYAMKNRSPQRRWIR